MQNDSHKAISDVHDLYKKLLVPFMKIRRDLPFPTEPERGETDGEHSFTLVMVAISLNQRLSLGLDDGKIALYATVHDLVEAHAGDLSVKASEDEHTMKAANEHEALMVIQNDFKETFPWIAETIEKYEARSDDESKFVYVVDKCLGAFGWFAGDGGGWAHYYPDKEGLLYQAVVARLRSKVELHADTKMLDLFDTLHAELEKQRGSYFNKSAK